MVWQTNIRKQSGKLFVVKQLLEDATLSDDDIFTITVRGRFSDVEGETTKQFTFDKNNIPNRFYFEGKIIKYKRKKSGITDIKSAYKHS